MDIKILSKGIIFISNLMLFHLKEKTLVKVFYSKISTFTIAFEISLNFTGLVSEDLIRHI